ncbi:MAG: class I SAM-dependent methyltransferase [Gammaproteobacteria bacterium]
MAAGFLTTDQVRAFYDRFGRKQDWQWFYEGPALRDLIAHGDFERTQSVFELGCGTGAFAARLLEDVLSPVASYVGVDLSGTMVDLARARVARFADRARVQLSDGDLHFPWPDGSFDRFVANYVLDLLAPPDITAALAEAHRLLRPDGRLCLLSLTHGCTVPSRAVVGLWNRIHRRDPARVGGCRPVQLLEFIDADHWQVDYQRVHVAWGVPSQVVVATRLGSGKPAAG